VVGQTRANVRLDAVTQTVSLTGTMKGSYVLLIELEKATQVEVGSLGLLQLQPGYYAYVGSAMSGLDRRVQRHLSSNKKHFWHIDYLLDHAQVLAVAKVPSSLRLECQIAALLAKKLRPIPHFGCSDCSCPSHIFHTTDQDQLHKAICYTIQQLSPNPELVSFDQISNPDKP